jgi:hypothetical protein
MTTLLLNILYLGVWVLIAPVRLLPVATLPSGLSTALGTVGGYFAAMNTVIPVTTATLLAVIGTVLTVEVGILSYKGVMWVIRKIPGIN